MSKLTYADIVSSLALLVAFGALAWNIIRDFIADRVSVEFYVAFGEEVNIRNSATGIFADAGAILPANKINNPSMSVQIINTGRRPIVVSGVGGKLNSGAEIFMAVAGLPKMLQPYEIFQSIAPAKSNFLEQIQKNEIMDLWVKDTKNKRWLLSAKGWKRLERTAELLDNINS